MAAPKLPSFFKTPSSKRFEYKPLYYDRAKEEMEERYDRIKDELGIEKAEADKRKTNLKYKMRQRWEASRHAKKSNRNSNIRLVLIMIVLLLISYYLFFM